VGKRFYSVHTQSNTFLKNIGATQFVKQADVVMLFFLFPQNFSEEQIKKNYYYYVERTLHKSSLSPSVHATVASWMQDNLRAYVYFIYSVLSDLQNKHGNTRGWYSWCFFRWNLSGRYKRIWWSCRR